MPIVFKATGGLILAALIFGQYFQSQPIDTSLWSARIAKIRMECPVAKGPEKVETKGDLIRLYDAYYILKLTGKVGLTDGCDSKVDGK